MKMDVAIVGVVNAYFICIFTSHYYWYKKICHKCELILEVQLFAIDTYSPVRCHYSGKYFSVLENQDLNSFNRQYLSIGNRY